MFIQFERKPWMKLEPALLDIPYKLDSTRWAHFWPVSPSSGQQIKHSDGGYELSRVIEKNWQKHTFVSQQFSFFFPQHCSILSFNSLSRQPLHCEETTVNVALFIIYQYWGTDLGDEDINTKIFSIASSLMEIWKVTNYYPWSWIWRSVTKNAKLLIIKILVPENVGNSTKISFVAWLPRHVGSRRQANDTRMCRNHFQVNSRNFVNSAQSAIQLQRI